ncbi:MULTISPECIES: rhodanese-like domain-containing protein [Bradyrhizobium]|uniref:rhodanese-like domain-containing protein n=1 Tax=Bradyrhizobium TaxID=374 RepID=UPI0003A83BDB|nr:rhodanese-like domain-containing protein [Bradyrhizobium denitrificans]MCL8483735.1 rhodanese-like domain-containing protein [Bradyrhizobium denitrificans]RTL95787.1 MAG: thiosulfate sulfurtransferase [Bradyrhizobiaceae bacterium]
MSELLIDVSTFVAWLKDRQELAVIDLRDETAFDKGAPLYATNIPAARLLDEIGRFIPRQSVRTVLVDGGDGRARELAETLRENGWPSVTALDGGVPAWLAQTDQERPTFDTSGVTFALRIRDEKSTPVLSVPELAKLQAAGQDLVVLDSRTAEEFAIAHVPGAISVPGAELVLRFEDVVPSADTLVVVSCAGLPRAIIGAQSLIDAGVPNRVVYLDDGTRAWREAGFELETGITALSGSVSAPSRVAAEHRIARFSDRIPEIDLETARRWQADSGRTTYLLDVRTPEEFAGNHLPETISAPGGQLLGVSFRSIAVRGARVVLVDDRSGVRAATTAHWLKRRGFELAILKHDFRLALVQAVA